MQSSGRTATRGDLVAELEPRERENERLRDTRCNIRRICRICALRACDVDRRAAAGAPHGRIFKNPVVDKDGAGGWLPMAESVRAAPGYVFAALDAREGIMDRHVFDKWLGVAEKEAELPKLDGSMWHACRRNWAIERKHLPLKDVAAAGGWKDVNTLLEIDQQ